MPEWLHEAFPTPADFNLHVLAIRLTTTLVLGCIVAGLYRVTHGRANEQSLSLMATLVMLSVLIAMVTLVIGESQARAFSLVGALAIIRFRTIVEDTRDTAFVIFAVAVGMAGGAGYLLVALVGIPIAGAAAFLFRPRAAVGAPATSLDFLLTVRIGVGQNADVLVQAPFAKHVQLARLIATTTARQGAALELTYQVRLNHEDAAMALVAELNGVAGVQNVELRRA